MASNPMQRQARNYFLLGMLVAILIAAIIVVFLFLQMKKLKEENQTLMSNIDDKTTSVLIQDVKSGDILTPEMFKIAPVTNTSKPANYVDINTLLSAYSMYTTDGVRILTQYDENTQEQYLVLDDGNGTRLTETDTIGMYRTPNGTTVQLIEAPVIAKIDIAANTMVTQDMVARSDEVATDDVRQVEYNTVILPIDLISDDYVDIRIMFPSGQNYIVLSKKKVTIPEVNGEYVADTIQMNLNEAEILTMSSAIVEDWLMQGSAYLYATKYVEAGLQEQATPTYVPSGEVTKLMDSDSNITNRARTEIVARYRELASLRNENINSELSNNGSTEGIPAGIGESAAATQESRQEYLQGLLGIN